jgi:hypothetical protein
LFGEFYIGDFGLDCEIVEKKWDGVVLAVKQFYLVVNVTGELCIGDVEAFRIIVYFGEGCEDGFVNLSNIARRGRNVLGLGESIWKRRKKEGGRS